MTKRTLSVIQSLSFLSLFVLCHVLPEKVYGGFEVTIEQLGGPSITLTDQDGNNIIDDEDLEIQTGDDDFEDFFQDFNFLNFFAVSNAPGENSGAFLTENTLTFNTTTDATLRITASDDRFLLPDGDPYIVSNQISGTFLENVDGSIRSALNPPSLDPSHFTSLASISSANGAADSDSTTRQYPSGGTPFTVQNVMEISFRGAGSQASGNISGTTVAALPEPTAIAIWLGVACAGVFATRRRKKRNATS